MDPTEKQLVEMEKRKWERWGKDMESIEVLYAEDFLSVDERGLGVQTKAQMFEEARKSGMKTRTFALDNIKVVRPTEDTAVVTYRASASFALGGQELPWIAFTTSVWARRKGEWQTVFYQWTPVQKG